MGDQDAYRCGRVPCHAGLEGGHLPEPCGHPSAHRIEQWAAGVYCADFGASAQDTGNHLGHHRCTSVPVIGTYTIVRVQTVP